MDRITLYSNLFLVCLAACIGLAVLAAVLFFALDIRNVFGYLSGRTAKQQIRKMEEASAQSGRFFRKTRSAMQYAAEHRKADMGISEAALPGAREAENKEATEYLRHAKQAEQKKHAEVQTVLLR